MSSRPGISRYPEATDRNLADMLWMRLITGRLALWADRWLIPFVMFTLLATDVAVGLIWILSGPTAFASPAYDEAQRIVPMSTYGALFIMNALVAVVGFAMMGRCWITGWLSGPLLGGQWFFWSILFALGTLGRTGSSFIGTVLALCMTVLHCLAGLAVATNLNHHPRRRATDPRG